MQLEAQKEELPCETPHWIHEDDITITRPTTKTAKLPASADKVSLAFFDGGCVKREGTAGYICFEPGGKFWFGAGLWLGVQARTNNEAEFMAVSKLLEDLEGRGSLPEGSTDIVINGDSELVISLL